jgi:hypothetical protein
VSTDSHGNRHDPTGRFGTKPLEEPAVSLSSPRCSDPLPHLRTGLDPTEAGLPDVRPDDWDLFDGAGERFVASVHAGQLSRSVVKGDPYMNLRTWQEWALLRSRQTGLDDPAAAERYDDFAKGLEHAAIALMSDKAEVAETYIVSRTIWPMGSHPRRTDYLRARSALTFKRTSKASRAEWEAQAADAPSESARRGFLTAAAILSGTDSWCGLREDPDATVGI